MWGGLAASYIRQAEYGTCLPPELEGWPWQGCSDSQQGFSESPVQVSESIDSLKSEETHVASVGNLANNLGNWIKLTSDKWILNGVVDVMKMGNTVPRVT